MLAHPSVKVLGHRNDVPELMRKSDILVLPSIEEGFGLVITEAMGSGCVPLASEACTEICESHEDRADASHWRCRSSDPTHHHAARRSCPAQETPRGVSRSCPGVTWTAAGRVLLEAYRETIAATQQEQPARAAKLLNTSPSSHSSVAST